jgi:hypothetical protein
MKRKETTLMNKFLVTAMFVTIGLALTADAHATSKSKYYPEPDTAATAEEVYGCHDRKCIAEMVESRASDQAFDEALLIDCPGTYIKNMKLYRARHERYKNHPEYKRVFDAYTSTHPKGIPSSCLQADSDTVGGGWESWVGAPATLRADTVKSMKEVSERREREHEAWTTDPAFPARRLLYCAGLDKMEHDKRTAEANRICEPLWDAAAGR